MIILDRLKNLNELSHNERIVAKYLLNYKGNIHTLTANDIAKDTFVSASTVIRLSKKLGCNGWLDLREKIEKEEAKKEKEEAKKAKKEAKTKTTTRTRRTKKDTETGTEEKATKPKSARGRKKVQ